MFSWTGEHSRYCEPLYLKTAIEEVDAYFAGLRKPARAIKGPRNPSSRPVAAHCSGSGGGDAGEVISARRAVAFQRLVVTGRAVHCPLWVEGGT